MSIRSMGSICTATVSAIASVPIPKFVPSRYRPPANFGIERTLATPWSLVSLWFRSSLRNLYRQWANFETATLIQAPLQCVQRKGGFVGNVLAGARQHQAVLISSAGSRKSAERFLQMRQLKPQYVPLGRDQCHAFQDFDCAGGFANLDRARLDVVLKPQQHIRVGDRREGIRHIAQIRLVSELGRTETGRPHRLPFNHRAAIERIDQRLAAAHAEAKQKMTGR